jgi:putative hydrolase of the HAD superfamily
MQNAFGGTTTAGKEWKDFIALLIMARKAIIFDLDNTIYAVSSIADKLFGTLFQLLTDSGELQQRLEEVKRELMRKPFQVVAATYGFSNDLTQRGITLLSSLRYEGPIEPFPDYQQAKDLSMERFLVTTGFSALQQSKIDGMGIAQDFKEIHIVDPDKSSKKEVFAAILERHGYRAAEVLVVGDDPGSELKAARELGIDAVLYDRLGQPTEGNDFPWISDFGALKTFVG